MKPLIIALFLILGLVAVAQSSPRSTLHQRIADDGQTLSIQLDGFRNGRKVHYDQTVNVAGWNGLQKELLKYRVYQSQGIALPFQEMPGLIVGAVGLLAFILTLPVVYFQRRKAALMPSLTQWKADKA